VAAADQFDRGVDPDFPEIAFFPVAHAERPHRALRLDTSIGHLHQDFDPISFVVIFRERLGSHN